MREAGLDMNHAQWTQVANSARGDKVRMQPSEDSVDFKAGNKTLLRGVTPSGRSHVGSGRRAAATEFREFLKEYTKPKSNKGPSPRGGKPMSRSQTADRILKAVGYEKGQGLTGTQISDALEIASHIKELKSPKWRRKALQHALHQAPTPRSRFNTTDFLNFAQSKDDSDRIVRDRFSGDLKTSSLKGRVLSELKGEATGRNLRVKKDFIDSIRSEYGHGTAEIASRLIGRDDKALTAGQVKSVLLRLEELKNLKTHRTHGNPGSANIQAALTATLDKVSGNNYSRNIIKEAISKLPDETNTKPSKPLTVDQHTARKVLSEAGVEQLYPELIKRLPNCTKQQITDIACYTIIAAGGNPRFTSGLQVADMRLLLDAKNKGGVSFDDQFAKSAPEHLNKFIMAADSDLKAMIKTCDPDLTDGEVQETLSSIREAMPRLTFTADAQGETIVDRATIGTTTYVHNRQLGEGGFGIAHLMESEDGSETLVVKQMIINPEDEREAKLDEARKEVRAHDYAMAEATNKTHLAKIKTALHGADGMVSIALESCELGDTDRFFGDGQMRTSTIDTAVVNQNLTQNEGDLVKRMMAHDLVSGMRVLQEECEMLHLDMKPANVFLGGDGILKIGDFGLGVEATTMTYSERFDTTQVYRAPETDQGQGEVSIKADTYTLGVMIYQLETGTLPFFGDGETSGFGSVDSVARDSWFTQNRHTGLAEGKYATGDATTDAFINALTHRDPDQRISMSEALKHPFFEDYRSLSADAKANVRANLVAIA